MSASFAPFAPLRPEEPQARPPEAAPWWRTPRHPRPSYPEGDPEVQRIALALRSEALNAADHLSRALCHIIWSVATWARREPTENGIKVQVTLGYVQTGAEVGRRAAELGLSIFRRWSGAEGKAGWLSLSWRSLEATWEALLPLLDLGMIDPPKVLPSALIPAFRLDPLPPRGRGRTRCGCGVHEHGDRDPSLLFDRARGIATCMVSREVFILQDDEEGTVACRVLRPSQTKVADDSSFPDSTINKDTPPGGDGVPPEEEPQELESQPEPAPISLPFSRDLDLAGRPGPDPRCQGITGGRLYPSGLSQNLSQAADRESWAEWQVRRWGGPATEREAWQEAYYREIGGTPMGWLPDRFVGIGWWRPTSILWMEGRDGRRWPSLLLEELGTGHILFDIDRTSPLPLEPLPEMIEAIREQLEGFGPLERVTWVIRTSSTGLQILVKLRRFRWDPDGFYHDPSVQRFLRYSGERIAEIVGGTLDPSAFAPRRFGRAPGWRVKDGGPVLSSLWFTAER